MQTSPKLHRIDQALETRIATEMPLAILLENGPGFALLLSLHLSSEPDNGNVILEDCTHLRIEKCGSLATRTYQIVEVKLDQETGAWIASPDHFNALFLRPSRDPYAVVNLNRIECDSIMAAISEKNSAVIFSFFRHRFGDLPKFYSPSPTVLEAGVDYASAMDAYPSRQWI